MKPTKETELNLWLAQSCAEAAQQYAKVGYWMNAAALATKAGEFMKRVKWELVK